MVEYAILNVPLVGRNLAASRAPRLHPSVPAEYSDMLSREVAAGEWIVDPQDGSPLNAKGQTLAEHLEFTLGTRPHWLVPAAASNRRRAKVVSSERSAASQRAERSASAYSPK
jgi:hypothetical protein